MQELIDKLQTKVKSYKRQAENAVSLYYCSDVKKKRQEHLLSDAELVVDILNTHHFVFRGKAVKILSVCC